MTNAEKRRRIAASRKTSPATGSAGGDGAAPKPNRNTLLAQARYRFDLALSRGPIVVIGYLGLVMLAISRPFEGCLAAVATGIVCWPLRRRIVMAHSITGNSMSGQIDWRIG